MTTKVSLSSINTVSLTDQELNILQTLLDGGDRGAFHYIYATMSDVQDEITVTVYLTP